MRPSRTILIALSGKARGAIFTEKIKRYAKEAGIDLGLSSPKKDPLTKTEKQGIKEVAKDLRDKVE